jgi:hypothetical protein
MKPPEWTREASSLEEGPEGGEDVPLQGETPDEQPSPRLSPGLQHLFRTQIASGGGAAEQPSVPLEGSERSEAGGGVEPAAEGLPDRLGPDRAGEPATQDAVGSSRYLRAYLAECGGGVLPLGVRLLDDALGGGLDRGLAVVGGDPGAGKTLLLDEAARSALACDWWVYYAAYREGVLGAWERFIARASREDRGLPLSLSALRGRSLDASSQDRVRALDARLQSESAPRLALADRLAGGRNGFRAFMDTVWWRRREARESGSPGLLVLIDDLQTLRRLIAEAEGRHRVPGAVDTETAVRGEGSADLGELVSRLDREFLLLGTPCLASVAPTTVWEAGHGRVGPCVEPGYRGSFYLRLTDAAVENGSDVPLELAVEKNGRTGWVGRLPLTLDRREGRLG